MPQKPLSQGVAPAAMTRRMPASAPATRMILGIGAGAETGYGGGLARKRWLLAHEAKHTPSNFRLEATA
jgi:hypothetical protein